MIFELGRGKLANVGSKDRGRRTFHTVTVRVNGGSVELRVSGITAEQTADLARFLNRGARLVLEVDE